MTTAATMLDAQSRRAPLDTRLQGDTVDVLVEAARTATQCGDACLREPGTELRDCIAATLDVADLATAAARVVMRLGDPDTVEAALAACAVALRASATICRSHGGHLRHCAICAEVCERAEEQCLRMEAAAHHLVRSRDDGPTASLADGTVEHPDIIDPAPGRQQIHLIASGDLGEGAD
jgi:hypothetical protein